MKIGVFANVFKDNSWEEACKLASAAGLEAIEAGSGCDDGKIHCNPAAFLKDRDLLHNFVKTVEKNNLELSCLSCKGNPLNPQRAAAEEDLKDMEDSMRLASKIGVKVVSVFAGCPGAAEDALYPNWITWNWPPFFSTAVKWQWEKKIIPFWKEMVKKAKKLNIKFGFEIHPGDAVYNPELFLKLREEVGAEEIACNLDPAHLFYQGVDLEMCIRAIGDAIVHVHAKDAKIEKPVAGISGVIDYKDLKDFSKRAWNYRAVGYGHGLEFWRNFVSALKMVGYDGVLSIEYYDPIIPVSEGLTKSIEFLKNAVIFEKTGGVWDTSLKNPKENYRN